MDPLIHNLWLHTALCLCGWLVGWILHLKWHPLRRHLSDAWELLTSKPCYIGALAALSLLSDRLHPNSSSALWPLHDLWAWRDVSLPLILHSAEAYARTLYSLYPPWPLALGLPVVLTTLAWRLLRLPYRYSPRKPSNTEKGLLGFSVLAGWIWLAVEMTPVIRPMPEWLQSVRVTLRVLFGGLTMAMLQILLIRTVIIWDQPIDPDKKNNLRQAMDQTLVRWRGAFSLAALDLLWRLWSLHQQTTPASTFSRWIVVEAMLVFAPLPIAIAGAASSGGGSILSQGAEAMRILLRAALPWLGFIITAVISLTLIYYTVEVLHGLASPATFLGQAFLPLRALVLATVHSWLFLATVFIFIRHGLKPASALRSAD